jgi:membrane protein
MAYKKTLMTKKALNYIIKSAIYKKVICFLKNITFKGGTVSLHSILTIFIDKVHKNSIFERANSVSFSFTLAIFPAILFIFTLIPYFPISNFSVRIMEFMAETMPESIYEVAASTIEDIISIPRGGLLSFGFIFALYMSTNGMSSLMDAFNSSYKTVEKRGIIKTKLIATLLTILLAIVLLQTIVFLIVGRQMLKLIFEMGFFAEEYTIYMINTLQISSVFFMFLIAISSIYYLAPCIEEKWKFISTGSFVATILSFIASYGFSYYINNFGTYNKLYGSIGAFIALMIWISMLSVIILLGFELNASIDTAIRRANKKKEKKKHNLAMQIVTSGAVVDQV